MKVPKQVQTGNRCTYFGTVASLNQLKEKSQVGETSAGQRGAVSAAGGNHGIIDCVKYIG